MDVVERGDVYGVYSELGGVTPEEADIRFEHDVLTIRGAERLSFGPLQDSALRLFSAEPIAAIDVTIPPAGRSWC
jgi:hypothetical protein